MQESTGKYRKWQEKQGEVKKDGGQRREKVGNGEKRRATARSFGQKLQEVSFLWDLFYLVCMPFHTSYTKFSFFCTSESSFTSNDLFSTILRLEC